MMKKKKIKKEKKESFFNKNKVEIIGLTILVFAIFFLIVLDPTDEIPPKITKECCDNWCAKGEMVCHRHTKEYVMCKYPEKKAPEGISPVIDFWVYDTEKLCYSDKTEQVLVE